MNTIDTPLAVSAEVAALRRQLWLMDKNGYLTLSDAELNDPAVLREAILSAKSNAE